MRKSSHLDKYAKLFQENMSHTEPLLQAVLTGHLIIESALDNILAVIFFHPEHIFREARLTFVQKVHVVRSYGLRKHENSMWDMILAVNSVRNELAHHLESDKKVARLQKLRENFVAEATEEMRRTLEKKWKSLEELPDPIIAVWSCSLCTGFLSSFEEDVISLRGILDALDEGMNPDRERVRPKTVAEAKAKPKKEGRPEKAAK
ncbi:MAG: hypothetical protein M9939_03015 [Mesorhizobium sp.]|nr:hypothetical protein [Mesorhizobium sp.]MCO5160079.1 hypothetical protein [Mesorhizobium sp.]